MKARIEQQALAQAVRWASRNLNDKGIVPALSCLLLTASEDALGIDGYDLETATRTRLDADTIEPGRALVAGKLLADVAANLPDGDVELVADDQKLTITAPDTSYELPVANAADYPALPTTPQPVGTVEASLFAAAIGHATPAVMPQKDAVGTVAGMGGIRIAADGERLSVAATNRYLIVEHNLDWTPAGDAAATLLLPGPAVESAAKNFAGADTVSLLAAPAGGTGGFASGNTTLIGRTIAAEFPVLDRFRPIPENAAGHIDLDPAELAAAAKRTALVNSGADKPVVMHYTGGRLHISSGADGKRAVVRIDAAMNGDLDDFRISFNPHYLATALKPITGTARMWMTTATRPAHIRAAEDTGGYWAVLMPVRLPK